VRRVLPLVVLGVLGVLAGAQQAMAAPPTL
jgi:hypothetical protein